MEKLGASGICCNKSQWFRTTSNWYTMMNMWLILTYLVCTLFTGEKVIIVHKHWTTATTLTALIPFCPFCLATFPQSLVLCLWWRQWDEKPSFNEMQDLREPWPVTTMAGKACVYIWSCVFRITSVGCYCFYRCFSLFCPQTHTYIQMQKSRFISQRPLLYWLKILGKHSVWHTEIKIVEVQLKLYVCMGHICSIVCV